MSEPICSKDCFNCPFPDCINDTFDAEDLAASEAVERDFIKPRTKEQLRKLERQRAYYQKNRERIRAYQREYKRSHYQKDRERILAAQKARREAWLDSPAENQRRREYQKEYQKEYHRAYYRKNRERLLAAHKAWREAKRRKENENAQSLSDRCTEGGGGDRNGDAIRC